VNFRRGIVVANTRFFRSLHSPAAASVVDIALRLASFDDIGTHGASLMVGYRKDSAAVSQPEWPVDDSDRVYVWIEAHASRAKRLRRNPHTLTAACTFRGKPLGPPIAASARDLDDPADHDHAVAVLPAEWGWKRKAFTADSRPLTHGVHIGLAPTPT
jgi:PPOX class probable F420-dependent enzyme